MNDVNDLNEHFEGNDVVHLSGEARLLAEYTLKEMTKLNGGAQPDTGGCRTFYSPAEWKARGESYGLESVLIVCHDGGDVASFFNYDYECYQRLENMREALEKVGYWAEPCTSWYTAIYRSRG